MVPSKQFAVRDRAIAGYPDDRGAYMQTLYVPHSTFVALDDEAMKCMAAGTRQALSLVFGPSGIGKSPVRAGVKRRR
ncbi:hypothetical protein AWB80_01339 [Caballeronia pedi]|uniref:Uncharacterized protein n=1 Tax=Caballeronia pedi TaxID=1777141 RepID=A0A157ZV11_9BURK|nr:hypothetical protein AWB80_01339 [Caballeronia pedi]